MDPNLQALEFLYETGHFSNPAMKEANNVKEADLAVLTFTDHSVGEAVISLQDFDANYSDCCNSVNASSPVPDGDFGPATALLMSLPRCNVPDFAIFGREATGGGYFPIPGCDPQDPDQEKIASVRAYIDTSRASDTQKEYIDYCKLAAQHCCAEFGLRVRWTDDKAKSELSIAFKPISGSTIGYFYLPQSKTCHQHLDGFLDNRYNPDSYRFALLLIHEMFGHGIGHQHTSGGIMNPSMLETPKSPKGWPTWNDGARRNEGAKRMAEWFGGEKVSITPDGEPDPPDFSIHLKGDLEIMLGPASLGSVRVDTK